jgi:aminopeptidase N
MRMAYHLAIMKPKQWEDIIATQRGRIINADRQKEFEFVSRGCTPDKEAQRILFESLLEPENREVEPYAQALLSLLSSHLREPHNNAYITPGLEALIDIQKTSDIFFPGKWCSALLGNHKSKEAKKMVEDFLASHKDYPLSLKNKILQESFSLFNEKAFLVY